MIRMQELVEVIGIVIKSEPIGDFDRRVVILTKERGKITAFAKGARRPGNRFMAGTNPFCFGTFKLYEGRSSYSLNDISIDNYFEPLRLDYDKAILGMYMLEIADYYGQENNDEIELLKLVYQSIKAIISDRIPDQLIRSVFEIKAVCVNGEFPGLRSDKKYLEGTVAAVRHIESSDIQKLFTFAVSEEVQKELSDIGRDTCKRCIGVRFKSLEMLDT